MRRALTEKTRVWLRLNIWVEAIAFYAALALVASGCALYHRHQDDVATVLGRFAAGDSIEDIQEDYQLTRDQVMAALAYATHVTEHLPPAIKSA